MTGAITPREPKPPGKMVSSRDRKIVSVETAPLPDQVQPREPSPGHRRLRFSFQFNNVKDQNRTEARPASRAETDRQAAPGAARPNRLDGGRTPDEPACSNAACREPFGSLASDPNGGKPPSLQVSVPKKPRGGNLGGRSGRGSLSAPLRPDPCGRCSRTSKTQPRIPDRAFAGRSVPPRPCGPLR